MRTRPLAALSLAAAVTSAAAVAGPLPSASAAAAGTTFHATIDPAGERIVCGSTGLTINGGTLAASWTTSKDGQGVFHIAGTNVPHGVTLTDGSGATYQLAGASHLTGTSTSPSPADVITAADVDHFVLRTAGGSPLGAVRLVVRLSGGGLSVVDHGTCEQVESD